MVGRVFYAQCATSGGNLVKPRGAARKAWVGGAGTTIRTNQSIIGRRRDKSHELRRHLSAPKARNYNCKVIFPTPKTRNKTRVPTADDRVCRCALRGGRVTAAWCHPNSLRQRGVPRPELLARVGMCSCNLYTYKQRGCALLRHVRRPPALLVGAPRSS